MSGYPVILDLTERLCVVVGAGTVGCRKTRGLLEAGAIVRLVSIDPPLDKAIEAQVELRLKPFASDDLDGAFLAFAATGDEIVDQSVCAAARCRGIPANSASRPENGSFRLPAVLRRGELLLTVATGGRSPALARLLRNHLAESYGPAWAEVVEILGRLRTRKLTGAQKKSYSYKVLDQLLTAGLTELVADGRTTEINTLLTRILGEELSLDDLGVNLRDASS